MAIIRSKVHFKLDVRFTVISSISQYQKNSINNHYEQIKTQGRARGLTKSQGVLEVARAINLVIQLHIKAPSVVYHEIVLIESVL